MHTWEIIGALIPRVNSGRMCYSYSKYVVKKIRSGLLSLVLVVDLGLVFAGRRGDLYLCLGLVFTRGSRDLDVGERIGLGSSSSL